jgi:hypothetical protein
MKHALIERLFVLLVAVPAMLIAAAALAQIPRTLSYQGVLTNDAGVAVPDGDYNLTFHIYDAAAGGSALWTEAKVVTVIKGTFNAILGASVAIDLPFDKPYWLGIQVEGNPELAPRTELAAAPYALNVADGKAVRSLNSLTDAVTLAAGANVTITPSGNTLTIAAAGTGSDGDWVISGDNMYSALPGYVGIGTSSPISRLHIREDDNLGVGLTIQNTNTGSASSEYIEFTNENGALAYICAYDDNSTYGNALMFANNRPGGYLRFHTGGSERARISSSGFLGVGTDQPLTTVHLQDYELNMPSGALHYDDIIVESQDAVLGLFSASSGSYGSCLSLSEISAGALADKWSLIRQTASGGRGLLFTYGASVDPAANSTVMYLDDNGEVGIGTTNPDAALEVAGQVKITGGTPGAGRVLTSDAAGLASWKGVTTEHWISPLQLLGSGNTGGQEVNLDADGFVKVMRPSGAGLGVVFLYIDIPAKIAGVQQRLQGITIYYAVEHALDNIWYTTLKRFNNNGTSTAIWTSTTNHNSTTWTSYGYTDPTPEAISGPLVLRLDLTFNDYGAAHEIYIGGIKVWTTE